MSLQPVFCFSPLLDYVIPSFIGTSEDLIHDPNSRRFQSFTDNFKFASF